MLSLVKKLTGLCGLESHRGQVNVFSALKYQIEE